VLRVNADRKRVDQVEALGVFRQDWTEIAWDNVSEFLDAVRFTSSKLTSRYQSGYREAASEKCANRPSTCGGEVDGCDHRGTVAGRTDRHNRIPDIADASAASAGH